MATVGDSQRVNEMHYINLRFTSLLSRHLGDGDIAGAVFV